MFLRNMKLHGDPYMERMSQRTRIYTMAMYASHCCTGNTILGTAIRTDTVKGYLHDVAIFILCKTGKDPRHEKHQISTAKPIQKVFDEYKRWEELPNRRSPWTVGMQKHLDARVSTDNDGDPHNLLHAAADWCALGLSAGLRRGEFMQPNKKHSHIRHPALKDKTAVIGAFLYDDFTFYDDMGRKITNLAAHAINDYASVAKLRIRWRTQKKQT